MFIEIKDVSVVRAVALAVDPNDPWEYLRGVLFEPAANGKTNVVATNRHFMTIAQVDETVITGVEERVALPLPKGALETTVTKLTYDGLILGMAYRNWKRKPSIMTRVESITKEDPDYRRVIPAEVSGVRAVFAGGAKTAKILGCQGATCAPNGVFAAIVTYGDRTDVFSVLMPLMGTPRNTAPFTP